MITHFVVFHGVRRLHYFRRIRSQTQPWWMSCQRQSLLLAALTGCIAFWAVALKLAGVI